MSANTAVLEQSLDALIASAPKAENVVTLKSGREVPVRGVTVMEFIGLIRKFPKVRTMILGLIHADDKPEDEGELMERIEEFANGVIDMGPEVIGHFVALALGFKGEGLQAAIDAIVALPDDDIIDLMGKAKTLTMPEGAAGFFVRVERLMAVMGMSLDQASDASPTSAEAA